jgi:DNA-binding transcriptional ArsR family regulator
VRDTQPTSLAVDGPAELFRVLGHETRLRLLGLLAAGERSVGALEQVSGIGQPGLSQQLAILRKAQLVVTRRVAKQVYYRVDPAALRPAADTLALLASAVQAPVAAPGVPGAEQPPKTGKSAAGFARML